MSILSKSQSMGVAAVILAVSTLLSRFMGLVRDKIISWQFGAGGESDMYFAAFVVPDIINYLLAGGFMSITLIPLLSKRFGEDEADAWAEAHPEAMGDVLTTELLKGGAAIDTSALPEAPAPKLEGLTN